MSHVTRVRQSHEDDGGIRNVCTCSVLLQCVAASQNLQSLYLQCVAVWCCTVLLDRGIRDPGTFQKALPSAMHMNE